MPFQGDLFQRSKHASIPKITLLRQFLRFAGAGAIGTGVHYCVLIALVQLASFASVVASFLGYIAGALTNYLLSRYYVFRSTVPHYEALAKFFTVALIGLVLNTLVMAAGVYLLNWYYIVAQVAATVLVLLWNFAGNKLWTFREKGR
jgi:putative flippase GtrA